MTRQSSVLCVALLTLLAASCGGADDISCKTNDDCLQGSIPGVCLPSPTSETHWCAFPDGTCPAGQRWGVKSGDSLASECVEGATADGGPDAAIDAGPDADVDASPDAGPTDPPITTGQPAELVYGQASFTTGTAGTTAATLRQPNGGFAQGGRLWIADTENARVLQWNAPATNNGRAADVVIGKPDFTNHDTQTTSRTAFGPYVNDVYVTGAKLLVAQRSRVLVFNTIPTANGAAADLVLGESDFTSTATGKSAVTMNFAQAVWSDGTRIAVADFYNNRVMIWSTFPTTNGVAADLVLGQSDFGVGQGDPIASPPTASSMNRPSDVWMDEAGRFYVVDSGNHRVMVWNTFPTTKNAPADFFIGQANGTTGQPDSGEAAPSAAGLRGPFSVVSGGGSLFVSDQGNSRVLVYTPIPNASGAAARAALGQDNLTSGATTSTLSANHFQVAGALAIDGAKLFVADHSSVANRVLRFALHF